MVTRSLLFDVVQDPRHERGDPGEHVGSSSRYSGVASRPYSKQPYLVEHRPLLPHEWAAGVR